MIFICNSSKVSIISANFFLLKLRLGDIRLILGSSNGSPGNVLDMGRKVKITRIDYWPLTVLSFTLKLRTNDVFFTEIMLLFLPQSQSMQMKPSVIYDLQYIQFPNNSCQCEIYSFINLRSHHNLTKQHIYLLRKWAFIKKSK